MVPIKTKIVGWWMKILGVIVILIDIIKILDKELDFVFFICLIGGILFFIFSRFLFQKKKWAWIGTMILFSIGSLGAVISIFFAIDCIFYTILAILPSARVTMSCDFSELLIPLVPSLFFFIPFIFLFTDKKYFFETRVEHPVAQIGKGKKIFLYLVLGLTFIMEVFLSGILFLSGKFAFNTYQQLKTGAGTLSFLELGGSPLFWAIGLSILGAIILTISIGFLRRKWWAWIGSLIIAFLFPTTISFLLGPPMAPAAAPIFAMIYMGGIIFSLIWIISLLLVKELIKKNV